MPKLLLHMHQVRAFIKNRHEFYNQHFNGVDPRSYHFKGVQNAFEVGTVIDVAIRNHYLGKEKPFEDLKNLSNQDRIMCFGMVNNYIKTYKNKEKLHSFEQPQFTVPLDKIRGAKHAYTIMGTPDLICKNYYENKTVLLEIKTGETYEALDFQTMLYCWASWRWNFKIPAYVLKRTLKKPRIRLKKNETKNEFMQRMAEYEFKIHVGMREVTKQMVQSFEKKLYFIIKELDDCLKNPDKFYKQAGDYWG